MDESLGLQSVSKTVMLLLKYLDHFTLTQKVKESSDFYNPRHTIIKEVIGESGRVETFSNNVEPPVCVNLSNFCLLYLHKSWNEYAWQITQYTIWPMVILGRVKYLRNNLEPPCMRKSINSCCHAKLAAFFVVVTKGGERFTWN